MLEDVSWYGSAYLLTEMSFQPTFGRLYTLIDAKLLYLTSVIICKHPHMFIEKEDLANNPSSRSRLDPLRSFTNFCSLDHWKGHLRSRRCGTALWKFDDFWKVSSAKEKTSWNGTYYQHVRYRRCDRPHARGCHHRYAPTYLAVLFLDEPSWVFHLQIWFLAHHSTAAGSVTFAIAYRTFKTKTPLHGKLSKREKFKRLDLVGGILLTAALVALFFSLQWGGSKYPWSNPKVYCSVMTFGILIIAFLVLQIIKKEEWVMTGLHGPSSPFSFSS